jgi:hypothetical protein
LPAGVLTLVLALSPPFTYGFGVLLGLDRLSWFGVLGILFGFAGVTVLVAPAASLPAPGASGWFMLSLLASVMFAGANVLAVVLRPPAEDSVAMASGTLLGAAVVPLVLLVVIDHGGAFQAPPRTDRSRSPAPGNELRSIRALSRDRSDGWADLLHTGQLHRDSGWHRLGHAAVRRAAVGVRLVRISLDVRRHGDDRAEGRWHDMRPRSQLF